MEYYKYIIISASFFIMLSLLILHDYITLISVLILVLILLYILFHFIHFLFTIKLKSLQSNLIHPSREGYYPILLRGGKHIQFVNHKYDGNPFQQHVSEVEEVDSPALEEELPPSNAETRLYLVGNALDALETRPVLDGNALVETWKHGNTETEKRPRSILDGNSVNTPGNTPGNKLLPDLKPFPRKQSEIELEKNKVETRKHGNTAEKIQKLSLSGMTKREIAKVLKLGGRKYIKIKEALGE